MNIKIEENKNALSYGEISTLTDLVGWGKDFYPTETKWKKVVSASSYIAYARDGNELIAFGRILEDGIMCMFYDIAIHPKYQSKGIGKALMNHLISKIRDEGYISIGLFVWDGNPTAIKFYEKLGFEQVVGMELKKYHRVFD